MRGEEGDGFKNVSSAQTRSKCSSNQTEPDGRRTRRGRDTPTAHTPKPHTHAHTHTDTPILIQQANDI